MTVTRFAICGRNSQEQSMINDRAFTLCRIVSPKQCSFLGLRLTPDPEQSNRELQFETQHKANSLTALQFLIIVAHISLA